MNENYLILLRDYGIETDLPPPSTAVVKECETQDLTCCSHRLDSVSDGSLSCWHCGKVSRHKLMQVCTQQYGNYTSAFSNKGQENCGYQVRRKRYYKSETHFRDHLMRYVGCSAPLNDDSLL